MASENVRMKSNEVSNSIPNPEDLHSFLHYFYFKDHKAATASYSLFRSQNLQSKLDRSADDSAWGVYVTISHTGTPERLIELAEGLERLAASFKGEYDGWELLS